MPKKEAGPIETERARLEHVDMCYNRLFTSDDGKVVLEDLRRFCFVDISTYAKGCTDATFINEGCRRVFLRIAQKIRMDYTDLYTKVKPKVAESKL